MGVCSQCNQKAVYQTYCSTHFISWFESTVEQTIEEFALIDKNDRVVVGVSGGKDSTVLLYLLHRFGYQVEALAVDEGIEGYRSKTLQDLQSFCSNYSIPLQIVSFQEHFGMPLDAMVKKTRQLPCTPCGIFRRTLLNRYAKKYTKIAVGHNLDDEVQAFLMNLFKHTPDLIARQGPLVGVSRQEGFTPRIKPLIKLTEKEVRMYAFLKGFELTFAECPYARLSYRNHLRDWLNELEAVYPGTKKRLLSNLFFLLPYLKETYKQLEAYSKEEVLDTSASIDRARNQLLQGKSKEKPSFKGLLRCKHCFEPSTHEVCRACKMQLELQQHS